VATTILFHTKLKLYEELFTITDSESHIFLRFDSYRDTDSDSDTLHRRGRKLAFFTPNFAPSMQGQVWNPKTENFTKFWNINAQQGCIHCTICTKFLGLWQWSNHKKPLRGPNYGAPNAPDFRHRGMGCGKGCPSTENF